MSKKWKATSGEWRVTGGLLASRCLCLLLFLFSGFPLFAHEVRPGLSAVASDQRRDLRRVVESAGTGRRSAPGTLCATAGELFESVATARCFRRERVYRALEHQMHNGLERRHDPHRRSVGNLDRCFGATGATRRHHPSDAPHARYAFIRCRGRPEPNGNRAHVSGSWGRAHFNRRGPSAVCAWPVATGARCRTIGQNRERLYRSAQRHPGPGHPRLCSCSPAAGRGGDRPQHRFCRH